MNKKSDHTKRASKQKGVVAWIRSKFCEPTPTNEQLEIDRDAWRLIATAKESAYVAMEREVAHLKGELAYMKRQRDALLDITWLDLPGEPSESTAKWRELFNAGWVRRAEVANAANEVTSVGHGGDKV